LAVAVLAQRPRSAKSRLSNPLGGIKMQKKFRLSSAQIAPIVLGLGGCLATDRILVDGAPVGYMYREQPSNPQDSGWRFFAGDEDNAYMQNNANYGVYDVNTIVNYCPDILPFVNADVGSAFERDGNNRFVLVE
jgi:hypothetical protein